MKKSSTEKGMASTLEQQRKRQATTRRKMEAGEADFPEVTRDAITRTLIRDADARPFGTVIQEAAPSNAKVGLVLWFNTADELCNEVEFTMLRDQVFSVVRVNREQKAKLPPASGGSGLPSIIADKATRQNMKRHDKVMKRVSYGIPLQRHEQYMFREDAESFIRQTSDLTQARWAGMTEARQEYLLKRVNLALDSNALCIVGVHESRTLSTSAMLSRLLWAGGSLLLNMLRGEDLNPGEMFEGGREKIKEWLHIPSRFKQTPDFDYWPFSDIELSKSVA